MIQISAETDNNMSSSPPGVGHSGPQSGESSTDSDSSDDQSTNQSVTGQTETQAGDESPPSEETLRASLIPFVDGQQINPDADVVIKVYVVTGRHGKIPIPERFCRECHMFTRRADIAAEKANAAVDVRVYSWWTHFLSALRYGGYHAPVMVVGGELLCQGYDVPTTEDVEQAVRHSLE